jgi:dTDP-L-rhamnose 4-epimerase
MSERVLVTGGAGFIGSRLVRALASAGHQIWVVDSLLEQVHGPAAAFPEIPGSVTWVRATVTDAAEMHRVVADAKPRLVFHLAAETGTGQSLQEVSRYCDVNVMGTAHLVEALRVAGGPAPRIVLASTRAVYGEGAYLDAEGRVAIPPARLPTDMQAGRFAPVLPGGPALEAIPTPETAAPMPASIYASTKLMQEYILRQAADAAAWDLVVLRFQNVYGPGQSLRNPYTGVLSVFIQLLLAGRDLNIYEDGEIVRDFVFVDDVVHALVRAGEVGCSDSAPINVGTGQGTSILDAARLLATLVGRDPDSARISGDFRPGDIRHAVADIARARALLGWTPQVDIATGIAALVAWARAEAASPS